MKNIQKLIDMMGQDGFDPPNFVESPDERVGKIVQYIEWLKGEDEGGSDE
jgi:hypothetical protein